MSEKKYALEEYPETWEEIIGFLSDYIIQAGKEIQVIKKKFPEPITFKGYTSDELIVVNKHHKTLDILRLRAMIARDLLIEDLKKQGLDLSVHKTPSLSLRKLGSEPWHAPRIALLEREHLK